MLQNWTYSVFWDAGHDVDLVDCVPAIKDTDYHTSCIVFVTIWDFMRTTGYYGWIILYRNDGRIV